MIGPKELIMIGVGLLVLTAILLVSNWARNRFGNNAHKNQT